MSYKSEYDEAREHQERERQRKKDPLIEQLKDQSGKPKFQVKESFRWMTDSMKVNDAPGEKVIIRGPALFSVERFFKKGISKNQRQYIRNEILRSARTLKGKPVDVNHEVSVWEERGGTGPKPTFKGHVLFGEEEDDQLEYAAEINNREYAQKIRDTDKVRNGLMTESDYVKKWGKKPLAGVSVDADFLKMKCVKCGEDFYDFKLYKSHMFEGHGIKDISVEPRGIVFKRLSLVEPPEQPGVMGADFEIVETDQSGMMRLFETMLSERGYALQRYRNVGIKKTDKGAEIMPEKKLGEGCRWKAKGFDSGEACVSAMTGKVDDPEAFCYGPAEETKEQEEKPTEEKPESCPNGMVRDPTTGKCVSPDVVIGKIDEAFKRYKRTMEIDICNNLVKLERLFGSMNEKFTAIEKRLEKVETGENPHLQETEKLTIRIDNLEAKLKGQFKGHSKPLDKQSDTYSDPEKDMRESARKKR